MRIRGVDWIESIASSAHNLRRARRITSKYKNFKKFCNKSSYLIRRIVALTIFQPFVDTPHFDISTITPANNNNIS